MIFKVLQDQHQITHISTLVSSHNFPAQNLLPSHLGLCCHFLISKRSNQVFSSLNNLRELCFSLLSSYLSLTYLGQRSRGFSGGSDGKESTWNAGDLSSIPGLGRSLEKGHDNPLQYSCLVNPHRQRSLEGYSPRGCKESDMTEQRSLEVYIYLGADT